LIFGGLTLFLAHTMSALLGFCNQPVIENVGPEVRMFVDHRGVIGHDYLGGWRVSSRCSGG
jgi:hypothetical protein